MVRKQKRAKSTGGQRAKNKVKKELKHRSFDVDQIVKNVASGWKVEMDEDLPGLGQFYCRECDRNFITQDVLDRHKRTKLHKKSIKKLIEYNKYPYDHKLSDLCAGLSV